MLRLIARVGLLTALTAAAPLAHADRPRPTITTSLEGHDLRIVVHDVTDYCATEGEMQILRSSEAIRILHDRPSRGARCIATRDLSFVVKDVEPGRYTISYERIPLVAPARPLMVASTTTFVR